MPNFFSTMPLFNNFSFFSPTSWLQQYNNPMMYNTPSVFGSISNLQMPSMNFNSFSGYETSFNTWQSSAFNGPSFDTFSWSGTKTDRSPVKPRNKTNYTGTLADYNPNLGKRIAQIALSNAGHTFDKNSKKILDQTKDPDKFTGDCAAYVKMAIRDAGAGNYVAGHGYQMSEILKNNKNFKEIDASSISLSELPAGAVLVYARGAQGYSSEYGHTEIVTEDGRAVSDGITDNLYKKPTAVFIPVKA